MEFFGRIHRDRLSVLCWSTTQGRMLFKEFPGSDPLHDFNKSGRSKYRMGSDKEMNVIGHDFLSVQDEPFVLSD